MIWMDSCKRVAELLSQRLDEPLSLIDEMKLRLHLSMCANCHNVDHQLKAIHAASADLFSTDPSQDTGPDGGHAVSVPRGSDR